MIVVFVEFSLSLDDLAAKVNCSNLAELCRQHIYDQVFDDSGLPPENIELDDCPEVVNDVCLYPSSATIFYLKTGAARRTPNRFMGILVCCEVDGGPPHLKYSSLQGIL